MSSALIVTDLLTTYDFEGADPLAQSVEEALPPLEYLLGQLGVDRIVLCGVVTEQCILYSALDAYVRQLHVAVPPDAVAHIDPGLAGAALEMMRRNMDADLTPAADCALD